jgi:hypothetical protein
MGGIVSGYNVFPGNDDVSNKTFYGFRKDRTNGHLYADINDGSDSTVIEIPSETAPDANSYSVYYWTTNKHLFSINENGHLIMEIR